MGKANVLEAPTGMAVPAGFIGLWFGAVNAIPAGWALCNGMNGTPDLRDRFVVGAGNLYAVGAKGGEVAHTLTVAEMPSHNHSVAVTGSTYPGGYAVKYENLNSGGDISVNKTGGGQSHENRPPYCALCHIMKL